MLTANRDYFCTHNCYIIILRQSCQIILPRTYITAVNDGVLRALIDKSVVFADKKSMFKRGYTKHKVNLKQCLDEEWC
ncbi:MAG: hypothetical protein MR830_04795, partial [Succinatimonas sp.]|nr:hypothetical protein [Succinatimonas sp.]